MKKIYFLFSFTGLALFSLTGFAQFTGGNGSGDAKAEASHVKLNEVVFQSDGNWNDPTKWSSTVVPGTTQWVVLNANAQVTDPQAVKGLRINEGYDLTVQNGGGLSMDGDFTNEEGADALVIEHGGMLLHNNTGVEATVKLNLTGGNDVFHLFSSPVAGALVGDPFNPALYQQIWVRQYDEPSGDWEELLAASPLTVGKGFSFHLNGVSTEATFTGVLNVASVTPALSNGNTGSDPDRVGWNLLGNPFATALDWDHASWNRNASVDAQVAVWSSSAKNYIYWNGFDGDLSGGIIPSRQAFFVKVNSSSPVPAITIPSEARVVSASPYYKEGSTSYMRLGVTSLGNGYRDAIFTGLNASATEGFDNQFDVWKLFGGADAPQLFIPLGESEFSINTLPQVPATGEMQLGFQSGVNGEFMIEASRLDAFGEQATIHLLDQATNTLIDLRSEPVYSFSATTSDNVNRFKLLFGTTGITNPALLLSARVYATTSALIVNVADADGFTVEMRNMTGQLLLKKQVDHGSEVTLNGNYTPGAYLVTVTTSSRSVAKKILVM